MRKSKPKLDLSIDQEITQRIRNELPMLLNSVGSDGSPFGEYQVFAAKYQNSVFLSKYRGSETDGPSLLRSRAIVKWLVVEDRNRRTNERIYSSDPSFRLHGSKERACGWSILNRAAWHVQQILGTSPPEEILSGSSFSGGASTSRKRGPATLPSKFLGRIDATPSCLPHFLKFFKEAATWEFYSPTSGLPRLVKGNVLFTVPKTSVIDRVACKEPDCNILCQKGIGDFIRRRLKTLARIDLNDQSINKDLARKGSIDNGLATIDLSSASDSMTVGLVCALLPREWFNLLSDLRSPKTFIFGLSHKNEMFSSMGNGFTFELESLLFWALARAVAYFSRVRGRISVYGDDIIVPSSISGTLIHVLSWVGFKTNVDKTFVKGPFRESCGGHYYAGLDVTPFYLRAPIRNVSDLILFLNQYRAWLIRTELDTFDGGYSKRNAFVKLWYSLAKLVPKPLHGGFSLESRLQLASKGRQQCELQPVIRSSEALERKYQHGMYLQRLRMLDKADLYHESTMDLSSTEGSGVDVDVTGATNFSALPVHTGEYVMIGCKVEPSVFGVVRPLFACEQ